MNLRARLAKLESHVGGDTPARRRLARLCTILDRHTNPDAPAVQPQDLPSHWNTLADLVLASYEVGDRVAEPKSLPPRTRADASSPGTGAG